MQNVNGLKGQNYLLLKSVSVRFLCSFFLTLHLGCGGPPQDTTEGSETPAQVQLVSGTVTSFPDLVVGIPQTVLIEIENLSTTVPATNLRSDSALNPPYTFSGGAFPGTGGSCAPSLGAGGRCTFELIISPTLAGSFSESIVLQYFDGIADQTLVVTLQSQARLPQPANLVLSPSVAQDFGVVAIGGLRDITIRLENTGEQQATGIVLSGLNPPFSVQSNTCGVTLDPGSSCQWVIRFEPTLAVVSNDTLQVDYNDGVANQVLTLDMSGEGRVAGFISVDEGLSFDYGVILAGFTSSQTLTLRNTGGGNASALAFADVAAPFNVSFNNCPALLVPGATCQMTIDYSPTLTVASNDVEQIDYFDGFSNQSFNVSFAGMGFSNAPLVTLTDPLVTPSNQNNPTFQVSNLIAGIDVNLYRDALCGAVIATDSALAATLDMTVVIPEGDFPFHVRTVDSDGNLSACSASFANYEYDNTAPAPPTNILLATPFTSNSAVSPNFTWTASLSGDVVDYQVGISDNPAGGNNFGGFTSKGNVTTASQSGLSLNECDYYYVSIQSIDQVGLVSATYEVSASSFRYDSAVPTAPTGLNEGGDGSLTNSATVTWNAASDACGISHYEVAISEDVNTNNILDPGEVGNVVAFTDVGNITSHRYNGLNLTNGVPHYTSIIAVDTTGRSSVVAVSDPWIVYDPSIELPDMIVWLDANDPVTVLDSSGRDGFDPAFNGQADRWLDKSGSAVDHDFRLSSGATRPAYDDVNFEMLFDGVNTGMTTPDHPEINTATVIQRNITVAFETSGDVLSRQVLYEEGGNVRGMNVYLFNGRIYCGFYNTPNDGDGSQPFVSVSDPVSTNSVYFVTWVFDYTNFAGGGGPDGDLICYVNGAQIGATTTTSRLHAHSGNVGLGRIDNTACFEDSSCPNNGAPFDGSIFEVMLFNNAPDAADVTNVHTYLDNKWN